MDVIKVPTDVVDEAIGALAAGKDKQELEYMRRRTALRRFVELSPEVLTKKQLKALWKVAKARKGEPGWKSEIEFMMQAARDPSTVLCTTVKSFHTAFKQYMQDQFIKGWMFQREEYGAVTPYLVTKCDYQPPGRNQTELVTVHLEYVDVHGRAHSANTRVYFGTMLEAFKDMNREAAEAAQAALDAAEEEDEDDDDGEDEDGAKAKLREKERLRRLKEAAKLPDGVPMDRVLSKLGYYKETDELHAAYEKQTDKFMKLVTKYGSQLTIRGQGDSSRSDEEEDEGRSWYWGRGWGKQSMLVDGRPSRGIMDTRPLTTLTAEGGRKAVRGRARDQDEMAETAIDLESLTKNDFFQGKAPNEVFYDNSLVKDSMLIVPLHLELRIFHLEKHQFYNLHVVNMKPYKYKPEMLKQLILPEDVIELAEMLIEAEEEDAEDIVEGKSQGTMVTCIGDPGLGKTLLAEVMSEAVGKPLYKIQAAQLGLDPESLESNLKKLLHRAERWGAVMMIDEANAYIHDRGVDVHQNAIVGVFLRLLEYYRGTIILTTNQTSADGSDMDIDDAILSRSNAVICFELPTPSDALKIWRVQADLIKAKITKETIKEASTYFKYSGRSIRQLLRLTSRLVKRKKETEITLERLKQASKFISTSRKERIEQADAEEAPAS